MNKKIVCLFGVMWFVVFFPVQAIDLSTALGLLKAKLLTLATTLGVQKPLPEGQFLKNFKTPEFEKGSPKQDTGDFIKISDVYGNKTTNLCVLRSILEDLNKEIKEKNKHSKNVIKVPDFYGLKHDSLWSYVEKAISFDWKNFLKAQDNNIMLTNDAKKILETIQTKIRNLFKDEKIISDSLKQEIGTFIKGKQDTLLMVRSTGREDTLKVANAGGNETITGVKPLVKDIWEAVGEVIASYFGEKSLSQRLISGDDIKQTPFIPVLLQEMIGEYGKDAPVPTSGVMFTREPFGYTPGVVQIESSYGHGEGIVNSKVAVDRFYSGLTEVVHATIRIKEQRLIYNEETKKLDFKENSGSLKKKSSLHLYVVQDLQCIARKIEKIYNWPMDIEFVVIPGKEKAFDIYLLQARPIVMKESNASYIKQDYLETKKEDLVHGLNIVVAGGMVREVDSPEKVIIRDDIGAALSAYNDNPKRDAIVAIIVKKKAPATSHEATTFRAYEKPVLYLDEKGSKKLEDWLKNNNKIFIDMQRALIVKADQEDKIKNIIENGWVVHPIPQETSLWNWNIKALQLFHDCEKKAGDKTQCEVLIEKFMKFADEAKKLFGAKHSLTVEVEKLFFAAKICVYEGFKTKELVKAFKFSDNENRLISLFPTVFIGALESQIPQNDIVDGISLAFLSAEMPDVKKTKEKLKEISGWGKMGFEEQELLESFMRAEQYVLNEKNQEKWITFVKGLVNCKKLEVEELAYVIKFFIDIGIFEIWLNAIFFQIYESNKGNTNRTLEALLESCKKEKETINWIKEKLSVLESWKKRENMWANPDTFEKLYEDFNNEFITEFIAPNLEEYFEKTSDLTNIELPKILNQDDLKKCVEVWSKNNREKEDEIKKSRDNTFKIMESFVENVFPLSSKFNKGENFTKLLINGFLLKIVTIYDLAIKSLTGSSLYKNNEKKQVENFAKFLKGYLCLQDQWAILCKGDEKKLYIEASYCAEVGTTASYLLVTCPPINFEHLAESFGGVRYHYDRLLARLKKTTDSDKDIIKGLLRDLGGFSVDAAKIGSKVDTCRVIPKSFEHLFTLFHQNLLTCCAYQNMKQGLTYEVLPQFVREICKLILAKESGVDEKLFSAFKDTKYAIDLIGIEINRFSVAIDLNYPIRQHSVVLRILYNTKKSNEAKIFVLFMGHDEGRRWEKCRTLAMLAASLSNIEVGRQPEIKFLKQDTGVKEGGRDASSSLSFEWCIKNENAYQQKIKKMCKYIHLLVLMSAHAFTEKFLNLPLFFYTVENEKTGVLTSEFKESFIKEIEKMKSKIQLFDIICVSDDIVQILYDLKKYSEAFAYMEEMFKMPDETLLNEWYFLDTFIKIVADNFNSLPSNLYEKMEGVLTLFFNLKWNTISFGVFKNTWKNRIDQVKKNSINLIKELIAKNRKEKESFKKLIKAIKNNIRFKDILDDAEIKNVLNV